MSSERSPSGLRAKHTSAVGPPGALDLCVDPWVDRVFHTLSLIPVPATDPSRLQCPAYARWAGEPLRDADLLGELYARCPDAHLLHGFAAWYGGWDDFAAALKEPLGPDERLGLPEPLVELFRIAVWEVGTGGYPARRAAHVEPLLAAALPELRRDLVRAARIVEPLAGARVLACHPLRRFGRVLGAGQIAVGVPDPALGVGRWAPVMQACHEAWVARLDDELAALAAGARCLGLSPLAEQHARWASALLPAGWADLVALGAEGATPPPDEPLVVTLTRLAPQPEPDRGRPKPDPSR